MNCRIRHCIFAFVFLCCLPLFVVSPGVTAAEEYSFDLDDFEKKPLEWGGHFELQWSGMDLNQDGALYKLEYFDDPRETLNRFSTTLQFDGSLQEENASFNWLLQVSASQDEIDYEETADFLEAYARFTPSPAMTLNIGKKNYKWGKGYAWNPASVIDRPKDPNNPEDALEGYTGFAVDLVKSFDGAMQTVALTTAFIPVTDDLNDDFGETGKNFATKLYLLYKDTDIDFIWFNGDSRPQTFAVDFSKNLATNFEIHAELAHTPEQKKKILSDDGTVDIQEIADTSYLLGLRYLTESDITTIVEFYHNGDGYSQDEMDRFYQLATDAHDEFADTGNKSALSQAKNLAQEGYGRSQSGKNYLYIKITQKEPFDLLYTTPGIIATVNLEDHSYTLSPEITYTGMTNWESRLRFTYLEGSRFSEYGEKQNETKVEMRIRYFF